MIRALAFLLLWLPAVSGAQTLDFPSNASLLREEVRPLDSYAFPTGPFAEGAVSTQVAEGRLTMQAWRIATTSQTTLQILRPLREQLRNARYRVVFECAAVDCGGFDFRFAIDILPPPQMQVAINDYRVLTAERQTDLGVERIMLLVSRTAQGGYVQVTYVGPETQVEAPLSVAQAPVQELSTHLDVARQLDQTGHAVLLDLSFETGSAQLDAADFGSLDQLAAYLQSDPQRRIVLVGHTDADGALAPNIALSERRAAAVLERLAADYGIARAQMSAHGVGYLAPIASNATDVGRTANRRVEVIAISPAQ